MYVEFTEQNPTTSPYQVVIQLPFNLSSENQSITSHSKEPWIVQTVRKFLFVLNWILSLPLSSINWLLLEDCSHAHSDCLFFRLNILIPSMGHHRARFHIPTSTGHFKKHGLTSPDGAELPFLCFRGYDLYESHPSATTFTILTATVYCKLMLSFQQVKWEQIGLWSRETWVQNLVLPCTS